MTSPPATAPYLPHGGAPIGLVRVTPSWAAVSVPSRWGQHVCDALGDRSGPVMEDPGLRMLAWPLPARGGADWPDARAAGVAWHGPGDTLLVPGLDGYRDGTRWLRPPTDGAVFTDPATLRVAIECVAGPLEEAAELGPLAVCRYCRTPTRDALLVETRHSVSAADHHWFACHPCLTSKVGSGNGHRPRVVRSASR